MLVVHRTVEYHGQITSETAYFVSDLPPQTDAHYFAEGIRNHWNIESFHYVKDVTLKEDASKVRTKNAPQNYALLRTIAINIFRSHQLNCIQAAIEQCANNIPFMFSLL